MKTVFAILFFFCFLLGNVTVFAQEKSPNDTIMLGAIMDNGVAVPMVFLPEFEKLDKLPADWVKRQSDFNRLRYNIFLVYPYAVMAAEILKDADQQLATLPDRRARKDFLKSKERELKSKFKNDLENLSMTQGVILVKLINRQTGRNCYSIIREMKGGFNAFIYQGVALLFNNNLKKEYDPIGDDQMMEKIVSELEASNYYKYYYLKQQQDRYRSASK